MGRKLRIAGRRHVVIVVGAGIPVARYDHINMHVANGIADSIRYIRNQTRSIVTIVCVRCVGSAVWISAYKYRIKNCPFISELLMYIDVSGGVNSLSLQENTIRRIATHNRKLMSFYPNHPFI